mmetsp:Transcript_8046/g.17996  ORF Transcript_8046/g.17996 Transcript_8046/m.17996 type:complete len:279 (-) Transcript_8046:33-869(-)
MSAATTSTSYAAALEAVKTASDCTMEDAVFCCSHQTAPYLSRRAPSLTNTFLNLSPSSSLRRIQSAPGITIQCILNEEALSEGDWSTPNARDCEGSSKVATWMDRQLTEVPSDGSLSEPLSCASSSTEQWPARTEDTPRVEEPVPNEEETFTTVMLQNLPHGITQKGLMRHLDQAGFAGAYDFCYMPTDFQTGSCRGFAFVNFTTPREAAELLQSWSGSNRMCSRSHHKALLVIYADIQGLPALLQRHSSRKFDRIRNPGFRPFVRTGESELVVRGNA